MVRAAVMIVCAKVNPFILAMGVDIYHSKSNISRKKVKATDQMRWR
jgi:hypothetical protein